MILRELFYFDDQTMKPIEDLGYNAEDDMSVADKSDTRKSRLTLKDINKARRASEQHKIDKQKELNFVRQMYGLAGQAAAVGG